MTSTFASLRNHFKLNDYDEIENAINIINKLEDCENHELKLAVTFLNRAFYELSEKELTILNKPEFFKLIVRILSKLDNKEFMKDERQWAIYYQTLGLVWNHLSFFRSCSVDERKNLLNLCSKWLECDKEIKDLKYRDVLSGYLTILFMISDELDLNQNKITEQIFNRLPAFIKQENDKYISILALINKLNLTTNISISTIDSRESLLLCELFYDFNLSFSNSSTKFGFSIEEILKLLNKLIKSPQISDLLCFYGIIAAVEQRFWMMQSMDICFKILEEGCQREFTKKMLNTICPNIKNLPKLKDYQKDLVEKYQDILKSSTNSSKCAIS